MNGNARSEIIKAPLISIAMAVYNGSRFLEEQLQSILGQDHVSWELVAVDDASTDGSFELLQKFAATDPRIKVRRNEIKKGIVGNFLQALSLCQGELICYADQDDVWMSKKLSVLAALMRAPNVMLAYSDLEVCDSNLRTLHASFWRMAGIRPRRGGPWGEFALLRNIIPGCCMMFRKEIRDLLIKLLPHSTFIHDHMAFVLAATRGKIDFSNQRLVRYRQHAANNIGAFYPSFADFERAASQLKNELALLKPCLGADFPRVEQFFTSIEKKSFLKRLSLLRVYLWLRKDTLFDKCLGLAECFFPDLYQWCRRLREHRPM
ncbi:MAG TPA: glycosyltransferase family 2 protein [Candidatus Omnitrophota bacterium]|nr:glycosyltransferase family 2 protein [Candidatus Omnitrophota bacterium]